ncbi:MAG: hypothetical protein P857_153 [Candidatus Xenolissoclinum pacificiensis L6]|uniref:Uncharacterized protein n=1 Tax=Candidatus Xenolissoclinum pacificiensis L6 TaxID=1401685 RepID=W2V0T7_9RICK|nr:MAG: hypothetical protein P857_153 [Candidatus Xenolissoclinum pacificiensis L6]
MDGKGNTVNINFAVHEERNIVANMIIGCKISLNLANIVAKVRTVLLI